MKALTYHIHLLQPLLITQVITREENSSISLDYVPGGTIRGALANAYLGMHGDSDVSKPDSATRRFFFDGGMHFLNALPLSRLGARTLPKPLSWRVDKDKRDDADAEVFDLAVLSGTNTRPEQMATPSGSFFLRPNPGADDVELTSSRRVSAAHNFSNQRFRKQQNDSGVFRYDALDEGQIFAGVILARDDADLETLRQLLNNRELGIGGSRSAGYGWVKFERVQIEDSWRESQPQTALGGSNVITLLSDAILRDQQGNYTASLGAALGLPKPVEPAFFQTCIVGGFNRAWGLPMPQAMAVRAGSVFVFPNDSTTTQVLRETEQQGVGERRADGFGRFALNLHTQPTFRRVPVPQPSSRTINLQEDSRELVQKMVNRRLRGVLDERLMEALALLDSPTGEISPHQLNRVRMVVRRAWRDGRIGEIDEHLKQLKSDAKEQFRRARINNERLIQWLERAAATDDKSLWQFYLKPANMPIIASVAPDEQTVEKLQVEYTARLVDGVLRQMVRHLQGQRRSKNTSVAVVSQEGGAA